MKVRFLIPWQQFEPGQVVEEFHDGMADTLARRGILEEVKEQSAKQSKGKK